MPQGDFLNFSSTAWATGLTFVVGYFIFVGIWLPRLGLTLAARSWVTRGVVTTPAATAIATPTVGFDRFTLAAGLVAPATGVWPEIFLFGVEFAGLLLVVSTLAVPRRVYPVAVVTPPPREEVAPTGVTHAVANLLGLWAHHRGATFVGWTHAVNEVTHRAAAVAVPPVPVVLPRLKRTAAAVGRD